MKSNRNFIYFLRNLGIKHRLSYRNQHGDVEVWYMFLSPVNIILGFLALVLLLFIIILSIVAYTPVLDLIPGYTGNKSRAIMIENIRRIDSLEQRVLDLTVYSNNIALIMEGKTPIIRTASAGDSLRVVGNVKPGAADSALRAQMEGEGIYSINDPVSIRRTLRSSMELMPPAMGVITTTFEPREGRFGVGIATSPEQQVLAVADGTVISSLWSPEQGWVVQIQHTGNLVSIYRNIAQMIKSTGDRVRAGEVIAYCGKGSDNKGQLGFELWHNGTAVDPQSYIVF